MALLFFKVFSVMIYTCVRSFVIFACVRTVCHSNFSILLETSPKHGFVKLCGIQWEQIFLTAKFSRNNLYMLVELMLKVVSISQYVTWRSCIISFYTALMFSVPTTDFGRSLRISSVSEWRPQLNSLYQRLTVV